MKLLIASLASVLLTALAQVASPESAPGTASSPAAVAGMPRFTSVDITIDSGEQRLAAYQFEFTASGAREVKIVGVEGGEHAAFREPPYYDPAALKDHRIIIAAFNTGDDLPKGRSRVARLHLQVTGGEPEYKTRLDVASGADGKTIGATMQVE